jgi:hypothetical protein
MDGPKQNSTSHQDLYAAIGTAVAPAVADVRRGAAFADDRIIFGAIRRDPDEVQICRQELPSGRAVVYCVHGHEASQNSASGLRMPRWTRGISSIGSRVGPGTDCQRATRRTSRAASGSRPRTLRRRTGRHRRLPVAHRSFGCRDDREFPLQSRRDTDPSSLLGRRSLRQPAGVLR